MKLQYSVEIDTRHPVRRSITSSRIQYTCAVLLLILLSSIPAFAQDATVYDDDPLGLIAGYNITTFYSLDRDDLWDVWICEVPEGTLEFSPEEAVKTLNTEVGDYFDWLSEGRYRPKFRVGGSIEADSFDNWGGCNTPVYEFSNKMDPLNQPEGALIIVNMVTGASFGGIGGWSTPSPTEVYLGATSFPDNIRDVYASGESLAQPGTLPPHNFVLGPLPHLATIAHEMGHAIGFPHSIRNTDYDNPMDIMSMSDNVTGVQLGTIAINRYAAGWIAPSQVKIHEGGRARYLLNPIGNEGTQMLVLRSHSSSFMTLGARVKEGYDTSIPFEGVESYLIDQEPEDCFNYPDYLACWGTERSTRLYADVGTDYTWEGHTVKQISRIGDSFLVEISDSVVDEEPANRFVDDDGNTHELNIEVIAALGITLGCNPPDNDRFCPNRPVTRAQMAAFLDRALDEGSESDTNVSLFSDIPDNAWYQPSVERLARLGVFPDQPGGPFRPNEALTRLEMAVWIVGAFEAVREVSPAGVFHDVPTDAWYAGTVEGLLAAGITQGCASDPPTYCPDDPVRRDQMASFLARVLVK